jgi:hypothetical protein
MLPLNRREMIVAGRSLKAHWRADGLPLCRVTL